MTWDFGDQEPPVPEVQEGPDTTKIAVACGVIIIAFLWFILIVVAFSYLSRCSYQDAERFRVSLGFSIATIFCPFFVVVPVCLNVR